MAYAIGVSVAAAAANIDCRMLTIDDKTYNELCNGECYHTQKQTQIGKQTNNFIFILCKEKKHRFLHSVVCRVSYSITHRESGQ